MLPTRSRPLATGVAGALLASIVALVPLGSGAAATEPTASSKTYVASGASIANPDRGLYRYTGTHYRSDGSGHNPLDLTQLLRWRTQERVTLVYRIFYLEKFAGIDTLDAAYLRLLEADLATARQAGVKLVVRFAYSETNSQDAPPARVQGHIRQLAPVLNANADVISVLQAGFIGQWGEWYYSDNFASDRDRPWLLSETDWRARGAVLSTLLEATHPSLFVQVRYPAIKQRLVPAGDPLTTRVGVHNDCFLASPTDHGTFASDADRLWLARETVTVPMGGETCEENAPRSLWPSASADLAAYHWSYLNADFHKGVLGSWGDGLAEAERRLGYRLRIASGTFPTSAVAGRTLSLTLNLVNDGYAAPFRERPMRLVMRQGDQAHIVPLPVDVRTLAPGRVVTLPLAVPSPPTPGRWSLHLALPDPSPRLAADPTYAVQLANTGTWDATRGLNDLLHSVDVSEAPVASPDGAPAPPAPTPTTELTHSPAPAPTVRVSALPPVAVTNGWGPLERDRSNGELAVGDGGVLTLGGRTFEHGLGVHAASSVTYALDASHRTLDAVVGIDDEVGDRGSAVFEVYVDGALRHRTPVLTGLSQPHALSVDVSGGRSLRLAVTDAGDGTAYDHADWAAAELVGSTTSPAPTPTSTPTASPTPTTGLAPAPAPLRISTLPIVTAMNGWGPLERDRANGEQAAGDGQAISLRGVQYDHGLGVHARSAVTYALPAGYSRFRATLGVDDEVGARGSVRFEVWVDSVRAYRSPVLTGSSAPLPVSVSVAGGRQLRLVVTDAGDGVAYDHADWAEALLS